jgi:hypothetical protein
MVQHAVAAYGPTVALFTNVVIQWWYVHRHGPDNKQDSN